MSALPHRKITRFYIINPIGDRRIEERFESNENVVIRCEATGKTVPAVGYEIGKFGMKVGLAEELEVGASVQIIFPNATDHIRCFGHVIWTRPSWRRDQSESGVVISAWHGIVEGVESWKKFKGSKRKPDRRFKPR